LFFFFSSRRRHTRFSRDWSSDVCSSDLANMEINMFWDGLFHAFTWTATLVGIAMLWKAMGRPEVPRSGRVLVGSMIMGWGWFNQIGRASCRERGESSEVAGTGDYSRERE